MKELKEILKAYDQAKQLGVPTVLATIVQLEGSSYRRPGARMLVLEDGKMIGAISGGCLEGDALKKALLSFSEKKSRLVTYDTSDEDDISVGVQLGCEGIIQVLFEYLDYSNPNNPVELIRQVLKQRQKAVMVTVFDLADKKAEQMGAVLLATEKGSVVESTRNDIIYTSLEEDIQLAFEKENSFSKELVLNGQSKQAFIEFFQIPIALVIVGAGNDAIPLLEMGNLLGWEVTVTDGRKTHAKTDRFINACQVLVSKPESILEKVQVDSRTGFVLMTHNYQYDLQLLKALIKIEIPYIGVLGPKKKLQKMLNDIETGGQKLSEAQLAKIYGPVGLDIGAETPEEIASSIVAEIQTVFNKKNAQMLKWKKESIHSNNLI